MSRDILCEAGLRRARKETPGCEEVLHFNNAGSALMPAPVLNTVIEHLQLEASMGGYEAADERSRELEDVYHSTARLIGAHPDEIAIVENATRAWDMAFYSIPFQRGDRILTVKADYGSNHIAFLQVARKCGVKIDIIPDDETGQVSLDDLSNMVDRKVRLIAVTHIPTNGGLVNPAVEIGKIARDLRAYYLLDACQSVGQIPINVDEIGCDMLSATSRKYLRGPRGVGFLYVRSRHIHDLEPPLLDLHAATWISRDRYEIRKDARRFENWESNIAAKLGMGAAIDYALAWGIENTWQRIQKLAEMLRHELSMIPGIAVQDKGAVRCGIVSFTIDGRKPSRVMQQLRNKKVNVSTSSLYGTRLDMEERKIDELLRASIHYYNTEEEVLQFCDVLRKLLT